MAVMIDVAALATEHFGSCTSTVTILPAERACFSGDVDRLDGIIGFTEYVNGEGHAKAMTLVVISCEHAHVRIHKCPECGRERRYGGGA